MLRTFLAFVVISHSVAFAERPCEGDLGSSRVHAESAITVDASSTAFVTDISEPVAARAMERGGVGARRARGYAILISAMVASAAATTYLNALLPANLHFLSQLIGQVSTLGIYVFGAPIWEPLSSAFRQVAFGVDQPFVGGGGDPRLLKQWWRTQNAYGLNGQMSRGVINAFITSVQHNFYEAKRAVDSGDPAYAADQIAAAAVRLRGLYVDLDPADPHVTLAIRTSFTAHVAIDAAFCADVRARVQVLDPDANQPNAAAHYAAVLNAWL